VRQKGAGGKRLCALPLDQVENVLALKGPKERGKAEVWRN
jgi:hypothetical protein